MVEKKPEFYKDSYQNGDFLRPESQFRSWIKADGSTLFSPEKGRYHLYVSLACPWSHRTVLIRSLRKLENVIGVSITSPVWNDYGWWFGEDEGVIPDQVNHKKNIIEIYRLSNPQFIGEETVPILWDKKNKTIVNNESRDIMRMFDVEFSQFGDTQVSLCPPSLQQRIDRIIDEIYGPINNGVYQAGFARKQGPYERAVKKLFSALDHWDEQLSHNRFVCGDRLTEADLALFVTLIRFDCVYYSHFKCNLKRIVDYPNLWRWVREVYHVPGVKETCNFEHIKHHYYGSHREINPFGIVPLGPNLSFD
jgi:glutathionyl-hydroquinone reductase